LAGAAAVYQLPVAFSHLSRVGHGGEVNGKHTPGILRKPIAMFRSGALASISDTLRGWVVPFEVDTKLEQARRIIEACSPDVVHAMRINFEGILAAGASPPGIPLIVSVWGNDFTLYASRYPMIASRAMEALTRVSALHCDCRRDLRLAVEQWGFDPNKPATVLPGAGGVNLKLFYPDEAETQWRQRLEINEDSRVVINPRGFRAYVRTEEFVKSIPLVVKRFPDAVFVCTGLKGNPSVEKLANKLGIERNVRLLPPVSREEMAELFRLAEISVSPSFHDGTPNTLLEAMACGCFPIAGDIESVREWIRHDDNGLLCEPHDPHSIAEAISRSLRDEELRDRARSRNLQLVEARADSSRVMPAAAQFYSDVLGKSKVARYVA
jgi:glycosyltransferase involved in cell wall biosynthesis